MLDDAFALETENYPAGVPDSRLPLLRYPDVGWACTAWDLLAACLASNPTRPKSTSVADVPYLSRGGMGRDCHSGWKAKLETDRPSTRTPFPAPNA